MDVERKVFRGVVAVIASVESDRKFEVVAKMKWFDPTSFQPSNRIPIDLDRCPSKVASWSDIEVDDRGVNAHGDFLGSAMCLAHLTGYHVTSLGGYVGKGLPEELVRGPFVGAVYLEDAVFERDRAKIDPAGDPWPTGERSPCQLTTVAYSGSAGNGDRRNKRYAGFLGRVTDRSGTMVTVELLDLYRAPIGTWAFDLSSADQCDPDPPLASKEIALRPETPVGTTGTLFLELRHLAALGIENPKIPIGLER